MDKEDFLDDVTFANIEYEKAINTYIDLFCEKQKCYLEFKTGNLLCFGDNYFNLEDIMLDLNSDCKKGLIFKWQNKGINVHFKYPEIPQINYSSYISGLRYKHVISEYKNKL